MLPMKDPRNPQRNSRITRVVGIVLAVFVAVGITAALSNKNNGSVVSAVSGSGVSGASGNSGAALARDVSLTRCFISNDGVGDLSPEADGMIVNHQSSMQNFYISVDFFQAGVRIDNGIDDESDVPAGGKSPWSAQGTNFNVNPSEKLTCKIVEINNF